MKPNPAFQIILLLLLTGPMAWSQRLDTVSLERVLVLPALDEVIRKAVEFSPEQRLFQYEIERNKEVITTQKLQWSQYFFVDVQASTGNSALLIQQATGDLSAFQNFNNGYRATLNMRMPLQALIGRKALIRTAKGNFDASIERKKQAEQLLIDLIIPRYYAVESALRVLRIKADGRQSTQVARNLAEQEFRQGQITSAELTHAIESAVRAAVEYEDTRHQLFQNLRLLENLAGTKLY